MRALNEYESSELEALQLALAIAYQANLNANGKDSKSGQIIRVWTDRVNEALKDAKFESQQLPFNQVAQ